MAPAQQAVLHDKSRSPILACICVTKGRDGEACMGNQKLEQDTTEGTHT